MSASTSTRTAEFNFDGLVGPTHNYAGLARGNLASQANRNLVSHPKAAALEGLAKMKFLAELPGGGIPQAVLPPHERPYVPALRRLGFGGSDADVLARAARAAPRLLAAVSSASAMWAANSATVSPGADTADGRLHLTPATLCSHFHRSLEAPMTAALLRAIFPGPAFVHHEPLPSTPALADEGAANHSRLCEDHGAPGIELFVYGHDPDAVDTPQPPAKFFPRQSRGASGAIARLHGLEPQRVLFARQNPGAVDAGVFHNDVIAVAHRHVLLYHEDAFVESERLMVDLRAAFSRVSDRELSLVRIPDAILPLADAVRSYLFNSQLVSLADGSMALIAPTESREIPTADAAIDFMRAQAPIIRHVHFVHVRQSMRNGGGPACLRLRVVLTPAEQAALHGGVRLTEDLDQKLRGWIERHYRDELRPADLADPRLLDESRRALDELTRILALPALYGFQR